MTTYKRIAAVELTTRILKMLAAQKKPVPGQEVARALDAANGTIMCHLATLEDAGFVRKVGEHYELGMELALFWARKKALLENTIAVTTEQLNELEK
ncbi:helix-turn-helix domain-containing protein [Desulfuromonas acetoxidans]|uniref:helix-turn-helix domain-containing protein n=1 Tax=Desulfuromonas acetoxidans TaxID=891 RepID=UPI00292F35CF|nr:helix-turn-helix domain-containing protein [Desulfuromonas acetoxidans]